jgi:hypothetical protein
MRACMSAQENADGAQQIQMTAFQSQRRGDPQQEGTLSPQRSTDGPDSDMAKALAASRAGMHPPWLMTLPLPCKSQQAALPSHASLYVLSLAARGMGWCRRESGDEDGDLGWMCLGHCCRTGHLYRAHALKLERKMVFLHACMQRRHSDGA